MNDFKKLLEENRALLEEQIKPSEPLPETEFLSVNFITHVKRNMPDVLINLYEPDPYPPERQVPETHRIIIHGHERQNVCAAPDFCHEFGYLPKNSNTVNSRLFYQKWPSLAPKSPESPPVGVQSLANLFGDH